MCVFIGRLIFLAQLEAHIARARWEFCLARPKISNTIDFFLKTSRCKGLTKTHRTLEQSAEQTGTRGGELRSSSVRRGLELLLSLWLDANESCTQTRSFVKGQKFYTAWIPVVSFEKTWHCIISYCFILEGMSKTRASCFITGSKHLQTIKKALDLRPRAFIFFSVFGTRDEALALVFDILH